MNNRYIIVDMEMIDENTVYLYLRQRSLYEVVVYKGNISELKNICEKEILINTYEEKTLKDKKIRFIDKNSYILTGNELVSRFKDMPDYKEYLRYETKKLLTYIEISEITEVEKLSTIEEIYFKSLKSQKKDYKNIYEWIIYNRLTNEQKQERIDSLKQHLKNVELGLESKKNYE